MPIQSNQNIEEKIIGNNVFFLDNGNVVGFNIFDEDFINNYNCGRQLVDDKFVNTIETKYNVTLSNDQSYFKVGKIIELKKIENTHLSLCNVDIGNEILQIVCGAQNVIVNAMVVVATNGILMNSGMFIKKSKLKGIDSNGMLCSQKELGITGFNTDGIIILDNDNKYNVSDIFLEVYTKYGQ